PMAMVRFRRRGLVWKGGVGAGLALSIAACGGGSPGVSTFDPSGSFTTGISDPTNGADDTGGADSAETTFSSISATGGGDTETGETTGLDETGTPGCQSNDDCAGDPGGAVCDVASGECVACTADDDPCALGTYCDVVQQECVPGCQEDADCGGNLVCNTDTNTCEGCVEGADCPLGALRESGSGQPGCSETHGGQPGLACCGNECVDVDTDENHCGGCDKPCDPDNATGECVGGTCNIATCDNGWNDCNE